jgi:sphingosine kinase
LNIDDYDAIVCCSGDGTPHELLNGFADKAVEGGDSLAIRALSTLPICQIPSGSGNSMAISLNGSTSPSHAALCVVKGIPMSYDLMCVTRGSKKDLAFLSQAYGLMADTDLGTEHLRWMGGARFTVGAAIRLLGQKKYPCDIYVKYAYQDKKDAIEYFKNNYNKPVDPSSPRDESVLFNLKFGTIEDEVSSNWAKIDGDTLGSLFVGKMPWVAADVMAFPAALPADGMMDMAWWNATMSRIEGFKVMTEIDSGGQLNSDEFNYSKILAYRLVPRIPDGYLSIDGESYPLAPFQVEILPRTGCLLSATATFTPSSLAK